MRRPARPRLPEWAARLRFLLSRRAQNDQADLDEELQFHLAQSVERNIAAGLPAKQARRAATIEFGGLEKAREETYRQRPGWFLETLREDVRYAMRGFWRNPAFTITVLLTLALGIGATTAVFSVVDRILFRSLPYSEDGRLVSIGLSQSLEKNEFTLGGFFYEWRDNQKPFTALTFEQGARDCNLTDANPMHLQCGDVAQSFLPTLGVEPILGRNFLPEEDQPNGPKAALISDDLWLSRYNRDAGVLNKSISIDDHPVRIVGVLPANFEMPRLQPVDIVRPAQVDIGAQHTVNSGIGFPMWAVARLKPGVSIEQARAEMQPLYLHTQRWIPAEIRSDFHLQIRSVRDRQMQDTYRAAWLLLGGVLAVLLIACANVASLFSARGAARARELAVRSALGASRGRLARQTLTEAFLLAAGGALGGWVLAEMLLRMFLAIAPAGIPFLSKARLDLRIVLFTMLVSAVCALFFGTLAAIEKRGTAALAARAPKSGAHARLRGLLVMAQIAMSVILLTSAGLLLKSFMNLQKRGLGLETRNVLTVHIPLNEERYSKGYAAFRLGIEATFRNLPGVTAVGMSNSLPPDGESWHAGGRYSDIFVVGKSPSPQGTGGTVVVRSVTPDYFRVLRIPILQGPGFIESERNGSREFLILSQLLASRLFPGEDPVGRQIQFGTFDPYFKADPTIFTVAGGAGNVTNAGLKGQDAPEYYRLRHNADLDWSQHHYFLLESALPPSALGPMIRSAVARLDPSAPVEIGSLTQDVDRLSDRPRFEAALLGFFALCGLAMAVIGVYGIMAYLATQRTQEIGVRMALGATRMNILRLISMEGMRMVCIGGAIGIGLSLAASKLVESLLFGVAPHDPATYCGVALLLALVALLATLIPARAAMRVDPVEALRSE